MTVFLTTSDVADTLHCSAKRVSAFRKHGMLKGRKYGKSWLYLKKDVEEFIERSGGKSFKYLEHYSAHNWRKINEAAKEK